MISDSRIQNHELIESAKQKFIAEIDAIFIHNRDKITEMLFSNGIMNEDGAKNIASRYIFETFLYQRIFEYEQTDYNRVAILTAIHEEYEYRMNPDYMSDVIRRVNLYFDSFKLPVLNLSDMRDKQIDDILNLPNTDTYKIHLYSVLLENCYNPLSEIEKYNAINSIIGNYYFYVVMPEEDEQLKKQREEQKKVLVESDMHSIPDLSNMYEGKTYHGHSVAEMIKDAGWIPKPAGKRSRTAQENRLRRFLDWTTYKDSQLTSTTIISVIYDEMLDSAKPKLYETLIEIPLLNALLNAENETIVTTKKKLFQAIGVIPNYFPLPIGYYKDTLPKEYIVNNTDLTYTRKVFCDSVYGKFKEVISSTLESLKKRKKIMYSTKTIIIVGGNRIAIEELPHDKAIDARKKILEANDYALKHTYYYDGKTKRPCYNWHNVMRHKLQKQFDSVYKRYISAQFGWSYTYEELTITAGTKTSIEQSIVEAQDKLKNYFIDYLRKHCETKVKNRNDKIKGECQQLLSGIEEMGLSVGDYQSNFDEIKAQAFPQHFTEIFNVMIDTEIVRNEEIENQVMSWKQSHLV